jgi:two-component system, NarL family, invasion response regulator UvrY
MIKVLIADDHPLIREGIRKIIERSSDIEVAGEAQTAEELLALVPSTRFDVIILDLNMPGMGGLEAIEHLRMIYDNCRIIVLSMLPENNYAVRVLKTGAHGYLSKDKAPKVLLEAIRKVNNGGRYVSPALAEELALTISGESNQTQNTLSNRELEVMKHIASGKSIKEISNIMHLSDRTISTYRSRVLQKMQLENNAQIVTFAIKNGFVD